MIEPLWVPKGLFVAADVHYLDEDKARAAMVAARDRRFSVIISSRTVIVPAGAPYRPGEFLPA